MSPAEQKNAAADESSGGDIDGPADELSVDDKKYFGDSYYGLLSPRQSAEARERQLLKNELARLLAEQPIEPTAAPVSQADSNPGPISTKAKNVRASSTGIRNYALQAVLSVLAFGSAYKVSNEIDYARLNSNPQVAKLLRAMGDSEEAEIAGIEAIKQRVARLQENQADTNNDNNDRASRIVSSISDLAETASMVAKMNSRPMQSLLEHELQLNGITYADFLAQSNEDIQAALAELQNENSPFESGAHIKTLRAIGISLNKLGLSPDRDVYNADVRAAIIHGANKRLAGDLLSQPQEWRDQEELDQRLFWMAQNMSGLGLVLGVPEDRLSDEAENLLRTYGIQQLHPKALEGFVGVVANQVPMSREALGSEAATTPPPSDVTMR